MKRWSLNRVPLCRRHGPPHSRLLRLGDIPGEKTGVCCHSLLQGSFLTQKLNLGLLYLLTMPKPLTIWMTTNWKILQEMGIPDHLTCLLRNLYAGQEATVRTARGTTDWLQIGKGVRQGCILSPCLFNFYAEYIMRNAGLEEAQAGIKIAGININKLS